MSRRAAIVASAVLLALYLIIELAYIQRLPLVMDEFLGAHTLEQFANALPYRDFKPPKTVLAFYAQLPARLAVGDAWNALLAVKREIAVLFAVVLGVAILRLGRRFETRGVVASLALLVTMSTFLERSSELRTDPLAAMAGLLTLLALMERRWLVGGTLAAIAFLCTQKGIYVIASAEAALLILWLRRREGSRAWLRFNASAAALVILYVAFWSMFASPADVLRNMLFDPAVIRIATESLYAIRARFWLQTLGRNPLFYGVALASMLHLGRRCWNRQSSSEIETLVSFGTVFVALSLLHKQPWPYFFVHLIPILFVINTAGLSDFFSLAGRRVRTAGSVVLAAGIVFSILRVPVVLQRDQSLQRATFHAAERLLDEGETYIDGTSMIYTRRQAVADLSWLDAPSLRALQQRDEASQLALVRSIDAARPKLVIENYRTVVLPKLVRMYIGSQFAPVWGNILLYAPVVVPPRFHLNHSGLYAVSADAKIDGTIVAGGATVRLRAGTHAIESSGPVRLRLLPEAVSFDSRFASGGELFPAVYDY
ncbi:MAG TPA: hypothetical protein VNL91_04850 [Thermoanaerobaculia bacterium]|nr:hypothetical protein [Thermoanaerobaculia bacterium]